MYIVAVNVGSDQVVKVQLSDLKEFCSVWECVMQCKYVEK